jgi:hypothetical protein
MGSEYIGLLAYAAVAFVVFVGGLAWNRYRKDIMRRFHLREYRHAGLDNHAPQVR